jgi:hypothetical protein
VILLMANAGVIAATGDAAPDTWRRLVGHMLRSCAAPGAEIPPLAEAPAPTAPWSASHEPATMPREGHLVLRSATVRSTSWTILGPAP